MHQCHQHIGLARRSGAIRCGATVLVGMTMALQCYAAKPTETAVEAIVKQFLLNQASGLPGGIKITMIPPAGALPACASMPEAFLPSGARAWGRVSVGVRCHRSATQAEWTRYLPAHVAVVSNYVVANKSIAAGETLSPADFSVKEADLTALPRNIITNTAQLTGMVAGNRLAQGAPVRQESVRSAVVIKQGQTVKVSSKGLGFVASTEGRAMSNGAVGAQLQVKGRNGQMFHGIVQADGTVELAS